MAQRDHGIHSARSTCWNIAGDQCRSKENQTNCEQNWEAQRTCSVKRTLHCATKRIGASQPQYQPGRGERQTLSKNLETDVGLSGSERHAESDLRCPLRNRVGHDSINAERRQYKRERRQSTIERDVQPIWRQTLT